MKAVILAGGFGTRISEESHLMPKPMIEIGNLPILCHIMKLYSFYGINDFIICCGYKGYVIKEFFANYFYHLNDITIDIKSNSIDIHDASAEDWKVTLIDTGLDTMTGGRLKRVEKFLKNEEIFCMTYGDGLTDVNIGELIAFHKAQNTKATVLGVTPPGRFGELSFDNKLVTQFYEKPIDSTKLINGGFFVLSNDIFNYIDNDSSVWEKEPMERLVLEKELSVFKYDGFWRPMDTMRDKNYLNDLWNSGKAPWKLWP